MKNNGLSVVIKNEQQFNRIKEFIGEDYLYLNYVPQMSEIETAIVIYYSDNELLSIGSVGSSEHQEWLGCRLVNFETYFN